MESNMLDDNKITMSLREYLIINERSKQLEEKYKKLIEYLYEKGFEKDNNEIVFDRYNLSDDYMKKLLKELDIERFTRIYEKLMADE